VDGNGRNQLCARNLEATRVTLHGSHVEHGAEETAHVCAPLPELYLSDQTAFGERDELAAGHDEMVERADVDQRQRLLQ